MQYIDSDWFIQVKLLISWPLTEMNNHILNDILIFLHLLLKVDLAKRYNVTPFISLKHVEIFRLKNDFLIHFVLQFIVTVCNFFIPYQMKNKNHSDDFVQDMIILRRCENGKFDEELSDQSHQSWSSRYLYPKGTISH